MKRLSSAWTMPSRFLAPPVATFLAFSSLYRQLASNGAASEPWYDTLMLLAIVVAMWWYFWPLKRVAYDGHELLISDYFREVRVPVGQLLEIRQHLFEGNRSVTLTFDPATEFGRSIRMIPSSFAAENIFREDSWVKELRGDAHKARHPSG